MTDGRSKRLRELAGLFTRLGFTAFGGPAAHVALMEDEIVTRRKWLDRAHFLDLIAAVNFVPGPNSTELAIHIGQLRAGLPGLIVAGACFICPAMLIILVISWAYVRFGAIPQVIPALHSVTAAVVAIILYAICRFARTAIKDVFTLILFILVAVLHIVGTRQAIPQPELMLLFAAAIAGAFWYHALRTRSAHRFLMLALPLNFWPDMARMALVLLKIGATLFGSGYVLITYLQSDMVDRRGWLTQQQLADAIAVGQFTPGPLLTTSTFVGFLLGHSKFGGGLAGGIVGGIIATVAIFLPAFILVALLGHLLQKLRASTWARGALDGMNAAVVGLMILPLLRLGIPAIYDTAAGTPDWLNLLILLASLIGLWRKINATWLIIAAGLAGSITSAIRG
jgi:chromate transporter